MEFFTLDSKLNTVTINADILQVPAFAHIWMMDSDENKELATKELTYVWYIASHRSPGNIKGLPEKEIHSAGLAFARLPIDHPITDIITNAIEEYKQLSPPSALVVKTLRTSLYTLNKSVNKLVELIATKIDSSELKDTDLNFLITSQKQISDIAADLPTKFKALDAAETILTTEEQKAVLLRGKTMKFLSHDPDNTED